MFPRNRNLQKNWVEYSWEEILGQWLGTCERGAASLVTPFNTISVRDHVGISTPPMANFVTRMLQEAFKKDNVHRNEAKSVLEWDHGITIIMIC